MGNYNLGGLEVRTARIIPEMCRLDRAVRKWGGMLLTPPVDACATIYGKLAPLVYSNAYLLGDVALLQKAHKKHWRDAVGTITIAVASQNSIDAVITELKETYKKCRTKVIPTRSYDCKPARGNMLLLFLQNRMPRIGSVDCDDSYIFHK